MSSAIPGSTLMTKLDAIPVSRSITCKNKIPRRLDNILDLEKTCKVKVQLNGTKLIYIYMCIKIINDTDSMCIDTDNARY